MKSASLVVLCLILFSSCRHSAEVVNPDPTPPAPDVPVVLSGPINEDFTGQMSSLLKCNVRTGRDDFRYYPAFPSISERKSKVMLLRIDPSDAAGIKRGPAVCSEDKCWYGSYSVRFRVPNTILSQPDLGVCASMNLVGEQTSLSVEVRLSEPNSIYLLYGEEETIISPDDFNANSKFYEYGIDWTSDKIEWWLRRSSDAQKTILMEKYNDDVNVPMSLSFNYYYSKLKPVKNRPTSIQAPLYAYELELDNMNYTPYDDEK